MIPKQGSKILNHRDMQYRWKARATDKGSEILCESNEISDGQMLVIQLPKVCNLALLEPAIDWAHAHGWEPSKKQKHFIIRKVKDSFQKLKD